ncbi:hypothetical protein, variant [Aphanomyces invadans]|uniref:Globin family profile domain-containing protein n=1 Tax=Aphanomyces invadans TaxID=157072 RepID=A0A024TJ67_9STRA|nr:hypothetical protein, variant [Aphanomyces invadans]ETV93656.1 hypothetical protein, variant [Aphanomyces invadans]|eukprot:XP_008877696.1 hypothetical protein, variant [Aphanomyces invadans]
MGHTHSSFEHRPSNHPTPSSIVFTTSDGSVGLTHEFVHHYVRYMPFEIKQPVLTRRHVRLIEANWTLILSGMSSSFDEFRHGNPDKFFHRTYYSLLFAVMPSCRTIFRSSMHLQGKTLFSILRAMTSILRSHDLIERMQALAERHLAYGCERGDYTTVGVTLLKTLEIVSGDQWNFDVKEAYLTAYCLILYLMLPVIVRNPPAHVAESLVVTITAVVHGQDNHTSLHPHTYADSHSALPSQRRRANHGMRRLTLTHSFPLRFFPGDGVILGVPVVASNDDTSDNHFSNGSIVKQYFPIASYRASASNTLDIYVDETTSAHHAWFNHKDASTVGCSSLRLFWVESDHHFELRRRHRAIHRDGRGHPQRAAKVQRPRCFHPLRRYARGR